MTVLGNGSSECMHRHNMNAWVETRNGEDWLLDCGWTAKKALDWHGKGRELRDIHGVVVTHVHGDHVQGLVRLAWESRFRPEKRKNSGKGEDTKREERKGRPILILSAGIEQELWDETLKGELKRTAEGKAEFRDWFEVRTVLPDETFEMGGTKARMVRVEHMAGKPCYGVVLEDRYWWTGDTRPMPRLMKRLDPQVCWHDARVNDRTHPAHATAEELIERYSPEECRRTWLVGVEDDVSDERYNEIVHEKFAGIAVAGQVTKLDGGEEPRESKAETAKPAEGPEKDLRGKLKIVKGKEKFLVRAAWPPHEILRGFRLREDAETWCRNNGYQVIA